LDGYRKYLAAKVFGLQFPILGAPGIYNSPQINCHRYCVILKVFKQIDGNVMEIFYKRLKK